MERVIYVTKSGMAWTVVREDGQLVAHRRVRAVHTTFEAAVEAARRYAYLTGESLDLGDDGDGSTASSTSREREST